MELPFTPIPPEQVREHKIYVIVNTVNGKMYVGRTCQSLGVRYRAHLHSARAWQWMPLYAAMIAQAFEGFDRYVVADGLTNDEARMAEDDWILRLKTNDPDRGYNAMTMGRPKAGSATYDRTRRLIQTPIGPFRAVARRVNQFDLEGNLLATHASMKDAAKAIGRPAPRLSAACNDGRPLCGFIFKWLEDSSPRAISWGRPVSQLDEAGNVIETFNAAAHAARKLGLSASTIGRACRSKRRKVGGFRWVYANPESVPAAVTA